jgi:predicted O-methyltransferase YrrM
MARLKHRRYGSDPDGLYRDWLADKARYAIRIVEVGCFAGRTTRRMAEETRGYIWAVDHWQGVPGDPVQSAIYRNLPGTRARFYQKLRPWLKDGRVAVLEMGSPAAARYLMNTVGPVFDLIFIDADHRYRPVRRDIRAWRPLLREGGILSGHDIGWPGVRKAVDHELTGWQKGPGSLWFWEAGKQ